LKFVAGPIFELLSNLVILYDAKDFAERLGIP